MSYSKIDLLWHEFYLISRGDFVSTVFDTNQMLLRVYYFAILGISMDKPYQKKQKRFSDKDNFVWSKGRLVQDVLNHTSSYKLITKRLTKK